jgi:hypothetical protein
MFLILKGAVNLIRLKNTALEDGGSEGFCDGKTKSEEEGRRVKIVKIRHL